MSHEDRFDREKIKKEIDHLIKSINEASVIEELKKQDKSISILDYITLNANSISQLGSIVQALDSNNRIHSKLLINIGKILKKYRMHLIISFIINGVCIISIISILLILLSK